MAKKVALRTDDSRFANLPDYPFKAHYLYVNHPDYEPLRLHFLDEKSLDEKSLDEGASEKYTVLLLHGCPTWSYLYRKVISGLLQAPNNGGVRIIAPDFIGCGKSDKLLARTDYSYDFYVATLKQVIEQLDLNNIVLVCQDWGGPIGLRAVSEMPGRFAKILASNTLLPNSEAFPRGVNDWPGTIINNWVYYTQQANDIAISQIVQGVTLTKLSANILAAYDAPFPDARYKQGMLGWPSLIPLTASAKGTVENRKAWEFFEQSDIPFLTAFSDKDPSTAEWEMIFQQRVRGAKNQPHIKIAQAGHMVQEDQGEALAAAIHNFINPG